MKLIVKLFDRWCVLPGFQGGTDAAHLLHEAIGSILGNEIPDTRKYGRAFINIARPPERTNCATGNLPHPVTSAAAPPSG